MMNRRDLYYVVAVLKALEKGPAKRVDIMRALGTRNTAYVSRVVKAGVRYGLVEASPSTREVWLTDKGRRALEALKAFEAVVEGRARAVALTAVQVGAKPPTRVEVSEVPTTEGLPSFARDNPWLMVLAAKRGR